MLPRGGGLADGGAGPLVRGGRGFACPPQSDGPPGRAPAPLEGGGGAGAGGGARRREGAPRQGARPQGPVCRAPWGPWGSGFTPLSQNSSGLPGSSPSLCRATGVRAPAIFPSPLSGCRSLATKEKQHAAAERESQQKQQRLQADVRDLADRLAAADRVAQVHTSPPACDTVGGVCVWGWVDRLSPDSPKATRMTGGGGG